MTDPLQPNDRLLAIMEARELREAKEFERQEAERAEAKINYATRKKRQEDNDAQVFISAAAWQAKCDHRKGTGGKKKWRHVDYMMGRHTFANGLTQIKCHKCRMQWYPGDTEQLCSYTMGNYMKKERKTVNPTKISYAKAYEMTLDENTTNTETRSEMVTQGPAPITA